MNALKFDPKYVEIAKRISKEYSASYAQIANVLGVQVRTLNNWRKSYPELEEAINEGRDAYNSKKTEKSLVQRANGYWVTEEKTVIRQGNMTRTKHRKHIPADPSLIKFMLTNRSPDRWQDRREIAGEITNPGVLVLEQASGSSKDWAEEFGSKKLKGA